MQSINFNINRILNNNHSIVFDRLFIDIFEFYVLIITFFYYL